MAGWRGMTAASMSFTSSGAVPAGPEARPNSRIIILLYLGPFVNGKLILE